MTIGELIEKYCSQHGITNQRFAERCGVSKGYISQLINGKNPKTGKPITPTIETYIKMADAMNISIDELFRQVDDVPVALKSQSHEAMQGIGDQLTSATKSKEWRMLSEGFERFEKSRKAEFQMVFNMLSKTYPEFFSEGDDDDDPES